MNPFMSKIMARTPDLLQKRWAVLFVVLSVIVALKTTPTLFHPKDLLPLLPRQVSLLILRSLKDPHELLPTYVGSVSGKVPALDCKGSCFYETRAWLEFHEKAGGELGGGTLYIKCAKPHSWTCIDLYIFATPYRVLWDWYYVHGTHKVEIKEWESKDEYDYVRNTGIAIFLMESGVLKVLKALEDVLPLFSNTGWGEHKNIAFLKKYMKAKFDQRPKPWVTEINVDDVHSGDLLVISKIRGRGGGFHTLQKWVTGTYAGHTAVFLKHDGKLFVAESGHKDDKGENIIVVVPWEEWWNLQKKDDANPHIAILPLRPELRAKFDAATAWEYAESMKGKPYGYHNLLFSWIDTEVGNYPPPLDAHGVASAITIWDKFNTTSAARMWTEALNKRLGTKDLNLTEIMVETEKLGIPFAKLLTFPEQDDWVYSDGKSMTCVALVIQIYKKAGLFGELANSIQATEFTVKDAYILNLFEDDPNTLPKWCNARDSVKLPFCQILGRYRMELPGYSSLKPYSRMNEKCTSLPPDYNRDPKC